MRSLILCSISLLPVASFALPRVGDHLLYDFLVVSPGSTTSGTQEIVVADFESESKKFRFDYKIELPNYLWKDSRWIAAEYIRDNDASFDSCESDGGKLEDIAVPAGTFKVCTHSMGKSSFSIAKELSWGNVRAVTCCASDGSSNITELRSYNLK